MAPAKKCERITVLEENGRRHMEVVCGQDDQHNDGGDNDDGDYADDDAYEDVDDTYVDPSIDAMPNRLDNEPDYEAAIARQMDDEYEPPFPRRNPQQPPAQQRRVAYTNNDECDANDENEGGTRVARRTNVGAVRHRLVGRRPRRPSTRQTKKVLAVCRMPSGELMRTDGSGRFVTEHEFLASYYASFAGIWDDIVAGF